MTEMTDSTGKLHYAPKYLIILFIYKWYYFRYVYMYMIANCGTELTNYFN